VGYDDETLKWKVGYDDETLKWKVGYDDGMNGIINW
jgi:hypothetical protein